MLTYPIGLLAKKGVDNSFKLTINTALGTGTTFTLPLPSGQTYDFYWTPYTGATPLHVTAYNDANATYDYGVHGTYNVSIGVNPGDKCGGWQSSLSLDRTKIISIDQWGDVQFDTLTFGFALTTNLTSIPNGPITGASNVVNASNLFRESKITSLPVGLLDEMVNLTNLSQAFYAVSTLNGKVPDEFLRYNTLLTDVSYIFASSGLDELGEDVFYYNPLITTYERACDLLANIILPTRLFNLSNLSGVLKFDFFMRANTTGLSGTGTIQDVWNYALSATSVNAFLNQVNFSNYASIPNSWKGL